MSNELGWEENTGGIIWISFILHFLKAISKAKLDFDRTNAE